MNTALKLSLFGLGLVLLFATAFGVGQLVGPEPGGEPSSGHATPAVTRTDGGHG